MTRNRPGRARRSRRQSWMPCHSTARRDRRRARDRQRPPAGRHPDEHGGGPGEQQPDPPVLLGAVVDLGGGLEQRLGEVGAPHHRRVGERPEQHEVHDQPPGRRDERVRQGHDGGQGSHTRPGRSRSGQVRRGVDGAGGFTGGSMRGQDRTSGGRWRRGGGHAPGGEGGGEHGGQGQEEQGGRGAVAADGHQQGAAGEVADHPREEGRVQDDEGRPEQGAVGHRAAQHGGQDDRGVGQHHAHDEAQEDRVHHDVVRRRGGGHPADRPGDPGDGEPRVAREHRRRAEPWLAAGVDGAPGDVARRQPADEHEEGQAEGPGPRVGEEHGASGRGRDEGGDRDEHALRRGGEVDAGQLDALGRDGEHHEAGEQRHDDRGIHPHPQQGGQHGEGRTEHLDHHRVVAAAAPQRDEHGDQRHRAVEQQHLADGPRQPERRGRGHRARGGRGPRTRRGRAARPPARGR